MSISINQKGFPGFTEPQLEGLELILNDLKDSGDLGAGGSALTVDAIADVLEAAPTTAPASLARIQSAVSDAPTVRAAMAASPRLSRVAIGLLSLTPAVVTGYFGDSLTNDIGATSLGPQEYCTHAIAASKGAIIFGGKFGQGGMGYFTPGNGGKTFAQAKDDVLAALAAGVNIQRMCVLLGTNDLGAGTPIPFAQVRDATIAFTAWLEALGIEVVLSELPPRNDYSASAALRLSIHTFNTWVNRYCRMTGRRCQHFYSACVDRAGSGNWATGLNRDSIHPNPVGAKAMGLISWHAVSPAYQWMPYLTMDNGDATGILNPLMLTDARTSGSSAEVAGDGVPDYWGKANAYSGTVTPSIVSAGADAFGNWFRQDIAAGTNVSATTRSVKILATPGQVVQLGFRLKTNAATNGAGVNIGLYQCAGTSWVTANGQALAVPFAMGGSGLLAAQTYSEDTTYINEYVVLQAGTLGVSVDFQHNNGGLGGGQLNFGQFTLRNLTTLGIA
jgi:lysophospholipase L1-like esterase